MVASPKSMAQVAAVLAFVLSHMPFLAAQDAENGAMPEGQRTAGFPFWVSTHQPPPANDKDFSLALEMTIRESDVS